MIIHPFLMKIKIYREGWGMINYYLCALFNRMHPMKLSWKPYTLQLKHIFAIANSSRTETPVVLTQIEHEGMIGYGEASLPPYLPETQQSVSHFLEKINLSTFNDPLQLEEIWEYLDGLEEGNMAAKAAVDIALHDLSGKLIGQPWHRLWGLNPEKAPDTTYTIGIDTVEIVKEKTREVASNFNILKVKLGRSEAEDKGMIEAIRSVSSLPISVDANQGWQTVGQALDMIGWLHEKGAVMIEQPMPKHDLENIAQVTAQSQLPIFADESVQGLADVANLKGIFSGINIKLMKCGGMRQAWKMANLAKCLGMKVMIGCMTETSCAISAASQLSPLADFADLDGALLISNDCFSGTKIERGKICISNQAGIGLEA
ncbi:MAG: dipeptide epimerase [Bacteroidetes bacterium]|nr:dipeptide epimerase [Bacteroidota bacterium]